MQLDRRDLLTTAAALAAGRTASVPALAAAQPAPRLAAARRDFPRAGVGTYLNSAGQHPLSLQVLQAMERHLHFQTYGEGEGRAYFSREDQAALKQELGALIGAEADEIAFVQSTSDGENIVVSGLGLLEGGGNVVIDDLHFTSSLYLYKMLAARGVELRVVRQRNGTIPLEAMRRAVDHDTRLISLALVSNINGYQHDIESISALAHRHGARVYADVIQAAGAVPIDVRAMGIDFAAASTYKWLMGERGFGFLYVPLEHQEAVLPTTRWGHRQVNRFDRAGAFSWDALPGAARYETGNISEPLAAAALAGVRYIRQFGVASIVAHAQDLVARLLEELPALGYRALTPKNTGTPIAAFHVPEPEATSERLRRADVRVSLASHDKRLRVSVSVFNDHSDLDRLLHALAG